MSEQSFINRMTSLYIELNTIGERSGEMPDPAMDHIVDAASIVRQAIIDAPVQNEADIAGKLRFVAILVEDPHGVICGEENAAITAVNELIAFRAAEWAAMRAEARS